MGTRGLLCVSLSNKYKIAQYMQFDSYPSGQGEDILKFLLDLKEKRLFGEFEIKVCALKEISEEEVKKKWRECGANDSGLVDPFIYEQFRQRYPHLHRETGAEILHLVHQGAVKEVRLGIEFSQDSLFCEWCYVVDLDKKTFGIYKGFNKQPLNPTDRFYKEGGGQDGYYGVKLQKSYSFFALPSLQQFSEDFSDDDEDPNEEGSSEESNEEA